MAEEPRKLTRRELQAEYRRLNTPYFTRLGDRIKMFVLKTMVFGALVLAGYLWYRLETGR